MNPISFNRSLRRSLAGKPPAGDDAGMDDQLLAEQLGDLGVHGVLVQMAESGLIAELRCAMPECYSPDGRETFDLKTHPPGPWAPSVAHYPILKRDGGHLVPDNVRLSHILCNNLDHALDVLPEEKREAVVMRWRKKYTEGSSTNARTRGPAPAQRTEGHVEAAQVDEESSLLKR